MNGVINVLKPPAMSSGHVVGAIRRIFETRKVGHTGTLDPGAAGVLPICLGKATKLSSYIMDGDKQYIAELAFGYATDTLDSYGNVVETCDRKVSREELIKILPAFEGEILQTPPMYSAIKQDGQPLYRLAREGKSVKRQERKVHVHKIRHVRGRGPYHLLKINCSKGTYVRTLLADIAKALGSCAYTSFLLRSNAGDFALEQAYTLDELQQAEDKQQPLLSIEEVLQFMERINLPDYLFPIVDSGAAIDLTRVKVKIPVGEYWRVYCKNVLIGIGEQQENTLRIATKLNN